MLNFGTFFLLALAACFLWRGSLAEDLQSHYVCLLDDPSPNHCDNFCLNELRPLLKQVIQESQTKLEAKLEGQQAVLTRMAESQAKLEGNLLAVQTSLESTLQAVLNQLQAVSKQIDVAKEETAEIVRKEIQKIPPSFERIGSRYFKIVEEKVDWLTAERKCREMGGYLASFQSEEEINAITKKIINWGVGYWMGLNDRDYEGRFVSVASHKPAKFLKWAKGQPDNYDNNEYCVTLYNGKMWHDSCY